MVQHTLYILTRDFRTTDALTLYEAYNESKKSKTRLSVVFRFHPDQIKPENNPYYCSNSVQFMIKSLNLLFLDLPFDWVDPISDTEWRDYLSSLSINKIFIARDYTPFARKRFDFYQSIAETIEIDDITVFPIKELHPFLKLAPFIDYVNKLKFPKIQNMKTNWKKEVYPLPNKKYIHHTQINPDRFLSDVNTTFVQPEDLDSLISDLGGNIKGYSNKKTREQVGSPSVSYLSAFIKFGLISIRQVHQLVNNVSGPSSEDKKAFHRELYFRDFYYCLAWNKPYEVYVEPNYEQKNPRFVTEEELLLWKKEKGKPETISEKEKKEIQEARQIYENWAAAKTEYPLINAGIKQLTETGYMLNRLRMLTTSYLTQDNGLWWKYPEQFFANYLTDYDWTINAMNHQNISKIGLYPKYTLDFSIKRQEAMNPKDKQKYIQEFGE